MLAYLAVHVITQIRLSVCSVGAGYFITVSALICSALLHNLLEFSLAVSTELGWQNTGVAKKRSWHARCAKAHAQVLQSQHGLLELPFALPGNRLLLFLLS